MHQQLRGRDLQLTPAYGPITTVEALRAFSTHLTLHNIPYRKLDWGPLARSRSGFPALLRVSGLVSSSLLLFARGSGFYGLVQVPGSVCSLWAQVELCSGQSVTTTQGMSSLKEMQTSRSGLQK